MYGRRENCTARRPASTLGAEIFRKYELHILDVVPRPQRFEHEVGEAQDRKVFNQLLAQIMVNPIYRHTQKKTLRHSVIYGVVQLRLNRTMKRYSSSYHYCLNICSSAKYFFRDRVSSPDDSESRPNGFSTINLVHPLEDDAVRLADLTTSTNMFGGIDK
jgi:hypothetical protein